MIYISKFFKILVLFTIFICIFFIPTVTLKEVQSQDNVSIILDKNPNGFVWPIPRIY